jgi:hypothetical protein
VTGEAEVVGVFREDSTFLCRACSPDAVGVEVLDCEPDGKPGVYLGGKGIDCDRCGGHVESGKLDVPAASRLLDREPIDLNPFVFKIPAMLGLKPGTMSLQRRVPPANRKDRP